MITKENFKEVLEILGFQNDTQITGGGGESNLDSMHKFQNIESSLDSIQKFKNTESNLDSIKKFQNIESNIYTKYFKVQNCELKVDFKAQKLIYPKEITIHDETTSNFKNNENFVVFECVNRLLDKGYKPEHLELEPKWPLGRENKGGKADILVKDYENKPYLIIECKTTDSKKGEFDKEWDNMQQNGGQLFSYLQQERSVKFLCLYTSDFIESNTPKITYENYIINVQDNKKILNENKKQGYKDVGSVKELFNVWSDTYAKDYQTNGIFEKEIKAYQITHLKPNLNNLKIIDSKAIQKMRHQWATILRANTVGDKGTALNKLMNLFLCKITDELKNKDNLFFCWAGYTADTPFELVDRLQNLYKIGMQEYLKQDITYYSKLEIEKAFKHHSDTAVKQNVFNIFNELKYFQNGDFNFIEVYNKKLFDENFKVLLQIVLMLENVRFSGNESGHNQFLGDFFESYIADMPQHEGQYFTPTPLVNFIISSLPILKDCKVLDFACGAGHFLSEYGKINAKYKASFKGIDKDSRLAKISTIASTMYGNDMQITYENSLNLNVIENASVNIIISNPPYSVDDFLSVLDEDSKNDFELFKDKNLSPNKNTIECFFIEKASKALSQKGLLALVLPSSLFSNSQDSIFINTREILLRDFYILALCEFGNQSFFKTGTQPVILFALRKDRDDKNENTDSKTFRDFYYFIKNNEFDKLFNEYKELLESCLKKYSDFMNYDLESLYALFSGNLSLDSKIFESENFKAYKSAYKAKKQKQTLLEFIKNIENEKFLYFCYCLDSKPLIIKSPKDNDAQKKFLGYFWSNTKGHEGIHYYKKDSNDLDTASNINTPLFNPKDKLDTTKLNFYILQNYLSMLSKDLIDDEFLKDIDFIESNFYPLPKDLESFAFYADLKDCIDFSKVEFDKAINLASLRGSLSSLQGGSFSSLRGAAEAIHNPFLNCKYPLTKLGEIVEVTDYVANGSFASLKQNVRYTQNKDYAIFVRLKDYSNGWNGDYLYVDKKSYDFLKKSSLKVGDIVMCNVGSVGACFKVPDLKQPMTLASNSILIRPNKRALNDFIFYIFKTDIFNLQLKNIISALAQPKFNKTDFKNLKIPLPPLEVQEKIVKECEKVEEQYKIIRMSIEEYQRLIKAILMKCGVIADEVNGGGGGVIDSILATLQELETKLIESLASSLDVIASAKHEAIQNNPMSSLRGEAEAIHDNATPSLRESEANEAIYNNAESTDTQIHDNTLNNGLPRLANARLAMTRRLPRNSYAIFRNDDKDSPRNDNSLVSLQDDSLSSLRGSEATEAIHDNATPSLRGVENAEAIHNDAPLSSLQDEAKAIHKTNFKTLNALLDSLPTPPPHGWEKVKLEEIAKIIAGQSPKSRFYNDRKEGLLFYQGKKDFGKMYLQDSQIYTSQITKESVKNDILMSVRAPVGDVNLNPYEKICIGRGLAAIRPKEKQSYKFLFICIHNNKDLFIGRQGMAFESISTQDLKNVKIPLPPLEKQNKIISIIDFIESKITKLDSINKSLESKSAQILATHLLRI